MLKLITIREENLKAQLFELFDFDNDITGENGLDYTSEIALENGFNSTLEWYICQAKQKLGKSTTKNNLEFIITTVIGLFKEEHSHYWKEIECEIIETENNLIVALSCFESE